MSRTLIARCDTYRVDVDGLPPCTGEIRFRWGMSQSDPCDVCGGRCGIAVAAWDRVELDDPQPDSTIGQGLRLEDVREWTAEEMGIGGGS